MVADLGRVKAVFGVPDRLVERVRPGTPLAVTTETLGEQRFAGTVASVSPAADPQSRVFSVEVTLANADRRLKAGMIATVDVPETDAAPDAVRPTVSLAAVVKAGAGPGYGVFVVEGADEKAAVRLREVTLGPIAGNRVSVTSGLAAGERVVVTGASLLRDGEPVRIVPGGEEI
jgi:multidrug efflux system membrane fusion protein